MIESINIKMNTVYKKNKKIVLIGDGGVGKTNYLNRLQTGNFENKYIATMGVEINPLDYWETNNPNYIFNMWDCAGQEKYGFNKQYWKDADGVIVMFDLTSRLSFKNIHYWIENINNIVPNIPIIICGNKIDVNKKYIKIKEKDIETLKYQYPEYPFFNISAKSCYNIEDPILSLREKLLPHL